MKSFILSICSDGVEGTGGGSTSRALHSAKTSKAYTVLSQLKCYTELILHAGTFILPAYLDGVWFVGGVLQFYSDGMVSPMGGLTGG